MGTVRKSGNGEVKMKDMHSTCSCHIVGVIDIVVVAVPVEPAFLLKQKGSWT